MKKVLIGLGIALLLTFLAVRWFLVEVIAKIS